MQIPPYSSTARRSTVGGDVKAVIRIGVSGKIDKLSVTSTDSNLVEAVEPILRNRTTYSESCAGKEFELLFTFRLEGKPEANPPETVRFQPPNHFIITSRPKIYEFNALPRESGK